MNIMQCWDRVCLPRLLVIAVVTCSVARAAQAQVRASERATVSQTIDGTVIEIDYARPRLRGRTSFGGVVHWGEMWTPGANWATTLRVSREVRLDGHLVPAGEYSVWFVPTPDQYTVYLHWEPRLYHLQRPDPVDMFLAVQVTPSSGPAAELLTFSFPETWRDGATLQFQWGTTRLSLRIDVDQSATTRPPLTRQQTAPYEGEYMAWLFGETGDSTRLDQLLFHQDGRLKGEFSGGSRTFELIPIGEHQFLFEVHDEQGPFDVELDGPVVFTLDGTGQAIGFRIRGIEQPLWMRGVRAGSPIRR